MSTNGKGPIMAQLDSSGRERLDLRVDPKWRARVEHQAQRLGFSGMSDYIRNATTMKLLQDEADEAALSKKATAKRAKVNGRV
jgi:glutathionylspermidine synthase